MQYTDWMAAAHDPVQAKGQAARQGRAGPPLLPCPHDRRHSVVPRRQYSPLQHPPLCLPTFVRSIHPNTNLSLLVARLPPSPTTSCPCWRRPDPTSGACTQHCHELQLVLRRLLCGAQCHVSRRRRNASHELAQCRQQNVKVRQVTHDTNRSHGCSRNKPPRSCASPPLP